MFLETSFNGLMWTCIEPNTYDGAEDAGKRNRMVGTGLTAKEAKEDWERQYAEYVEENNEG